MKPRTSVAHAGQLIRMFRSLSAEMPMQQADLLLTVAASPGIPMGDLANKLQLASSSCSRNVAALSRFHRLGQPGLNLVETATDPREPRRKLVFLTQEGNAFVTKLMRVIDPDFSLDKETDAQVAIGSMHREASESVGRTGRLKGVKVS